MRALTPDNIIDGYHTQSFRSAADKHAPKRIEIYCHHFQKPRPTCESPTISRVLSLSATSEPSHAWNMDVLHQQCDHANMTNLRRHCGRYQTETCKMVSLAQRYLRLRFHASVQKVLS